MTRMPGKDAMYDDTAWFSAKGDNRGEGKNERGYRWVMDTAHMEDGSTSTFKDSHIALDGTITPPAHFAKSLTIISTIRLQPHSNCGNKQNKTKRRRNYRGLRWGQEVASRRLQQRVRVSVTRQTAY